MLKHRDGPDRLIAFFLRRQGLHIEARHFDSAQTQPLHPLSDGRAVPRIGIGNPDLQAGPGRGEKKGQQRRRRNIKHRPGDAVQCLRHEGKFVVPQKIHRLQRHAQAAAQAAEAHPPSEASAKAVELQSRETALPGELPGSHAAQPVPEYQEVVGPDHCVG